MSLINRFLEYIKIDTCSDETSTSTPSTLKQHNLAKLLVGQMEEMGLTDITYDKEHCYIYATIDATPGYEKIPTLGLIAHMDTAPAMSGTNVKPAIIKEYDGSDIILNADRKSVV